MLLSFSSLSESSGLTSLFSLPNFQLKDNSQQEEDENNSYGLHNQYDLEDVTLKSACFEMTLILQRTQD